MRFLLRMAFWLGVVLVLLPSGGSEPASKAAQVNPVDAVSVAAAAATDVRQFCDRQPDACVAGSQIAVALGHRAQAGAKMLYEFLTEQLGPADGGPATTASTGSIVTGSTPGDTLTPLDREPTWRGPHKDPRPDRRA